MWSPRLGSQAAGSAISLASPQPPRQSIFQLGYFFMSEIHQLLSSPFGTTSFQPPHPPHPGRTPSQSPCLHSCFYLICSPLCSQRGLFKNANITPLLKTCQGLSTSLQLKKKKKPEQSSQDSARSGSVCLASAVLSFALCVLRTLTFLLFGEPLLSVSVYSRNFSSKPLLPCFLALLLTN